MCYHILYHNFKRQHYALDKRYLKPDHLDSNPRFTLIDYVTLRELLRVSTPCFLKLLYGDDNIVSTLINVRIE